MIYNNDQIKEGKGNGTRCVGLGIKLKEGTEIIRKKFDGIDVPTVSSLDVEHMLCEYEKVHENDVPKKFKLKKYLGIGWLLH